MIITIKVKTPKGQAISTEAKLRKFIIGFNKVKHETWSNVEDNEFYWRIEGGIREVMTINKNLAIFDKTMKMIFQHKLMKKFMNVNISKEELAELKEMLINQTEIEVVKESTLQEKNEYERTLWDRIKSTFQRKPND